MSKNSSPPDTNENSNDSDTSSTNASSAATEVDTPATKRLEYLLKQSEIFSRFMNTNEPSAATPSKKHKKSRKAAASKGHRHRKTEKEEDDELLANDDKETAGVLWFDESPSFISGGTMRDYQVRGLNWMISLYENNINGVLADEMGLGKTLQTISILGYMKHFRNSEGPHIVIVPKSTLQNWLNEFKKWCPTLITRGLIGTKEERQPLINQLLKTTNEWNVIVTTYEMVNIEASFLRKIKWRYLVIDEAHRIKNENSLLAKTVRSFSAKNRLLLTGTPLQNNLHELWALLNFLLPDIFSSSEDFDQWFDTNNCLGDMTLVTRLHSILKPFMLRRIKSEVEKSLLPKKEMKIFVGVSKMQREWYKKILLKDIDVVNASTGNTDKMRLMNIVMHLRKCCNHPYLFDGAEEGPPYTTDVHLIQNCGKMNVLDKLLARLKSQGSRVLIFSQMTRMMDILEDYCGWRGYKYHRLDGQTKHEDRAVAIDEYNSPGSETFIFMLSTRSGGLGINLATADAVIIYDSDWNPQMDLQAMDRAHRIGQKKQVHVFRLITENTIDEKIVERAEVKLHLDKMIIQQGKLSDKASATANKAEMLNILRFGAKEMMARNDDDANLENDIDQFLKVGEERTQEQRDKLEKISSEASLRGFSLDTPSTVYLFEGENYLDKKKISDNWIEPPKRDRKINIYNNAYANPMPAGPKQPKAPKPPKQPYYQDYHFISPRLRLLFDKEVLAYQNLVNYKLPGCTLTDQKQQEAIDTAVPLTEEEVQERDDLIEKSFLNWNRRDYLQFLRVNEKFGRDDLPNIVKSIDNKTPEEVAEYYAVFWDRVKELNDRDKVMAQVTRGESKLTRVKELQDLLDAKFAQYPAPYMSLRINYSGSRGKTFSEEADRFLVCMMHDIGMNHKNLYDEIRNAVREAPQFRFDWYMRARTAHELQRRCQTLIMYLKRDTEENKLKKQAKPAKNAADKSTPNGILNNTNTTKSSKKRRASVSAVDANNEAMASDAGGSAAKSKKKRSIVA